MSVAKILVVEDESIVALDIKYTLEYLGYTVAAIADSGELAIKKATQIKPDLILMDIKLRGRMDGIAAAEQISSNLDIPVIYMTAYADKETLERAKITKPFGYIIKPFEERELNTTIEIALYKHRVEKQLRENAQWLTTVLKSIGDGVIASDINGCVTFMNPIAEKLTGWKQEEAIGRHLTEVYNIVHEATRAPIECPIIKALNEGNIVILPEQSILLAKDGKEVPIGDSAAPIKDDKGNITGGVLIIRDISERKLAEEQLRYHAFYDTLTGLPNRALFMERLSHASERTKHQEEYLFAILFLDIDRFKVFNDSLGHAMGDRLLVAIARRLELCISAIDMVARMGGDEFGILLEDIEDISDACRIAERILLELKLPFNIQGREVFTTPSIGIVLGSKDYDGVEPLIRDADIAMYRAKGFGRARYQVFDSSMHAQVVTLLELENDLRRAIERFEFRVYYQPIVSLETGKIVAFEALVRWQHPERGLLTPASFISVAEETGLLVLIDWWVIREACRQMRVWQQQIPTNPPLTINVNFSSKQLAQPNLVENIIVILQETNLDAASLKLEITETAIIENPEYAAATLAQLRDLGIHLHIDDFGTGYSSLSYLHRFPVNRLKIDRSFVSRLDDDRESLEIVRTIVLLARNLEMETIAEGIETAQQAAKLQELQCEYGQGYFYSKPLDSKAAEAFIVAQQQWGVKWIS